MILKHFTSLLRSWSAGYRGAGSHRFSVWEDPLGITVWRRKGRRVGLVEVTERGVRWSGHGAVEAHHRDAGTGAPGGQVEAHHPALNMDPTRQRSERSVYYTTGTTGTVNTTYRIGESEREGG
jgi:hypothetical protein